MHLGLVVYGSLDVTSGGNLYDRKLVEALEARAHRVEVLSLPGSHYFGHLARGLSPEVGVRLRSSDADLWLLDELVHPSLVFAVDRLRFRSRSAAPLVGVVHHLRSSEPHPWPLRPIYRQLEERFLRCLDAQVYNSGTTRKVVECLLGASPPCVVAPPGRDRWPIRPPWSRVRERLGEGGPLRVLFVGNVIRRKGLLSLLEALARLPTGSWHLDVVGSLECEPRYVRRVRGRAASLGLGDQVTVHGHLGDEELSRRLQSADVLAGPSHYEGFGIVYVEAMGFGLPVLATTAGAAVETVRHGQNGFLAEPGDVDTMADLLGQLAGSRALLERLSLGAWRSWERLLTWEESMAQIVTFLESLLPGGDTELEAGAPR